MGSNGPEDSNLFKAEEYLLTKMAYLDNLVLFNIIQITNISKSKLNQLDEWKSYEDPNKASVDRIKSRSGTRLVREVKMDEVEDSLFQPTKDIYKLMLRDKAGNYCYAYEFNDVLSFLREKRPTTNTPLNIPLGGRLVVDKGTSILNGVLLLKRNQCHYLGTDESDRQLIDTLNSNLVKKYINLLTDEVGQI
ncbi:uncharacterized protein PRCAT00004532001 [Priceomyces carsonii]|uniref:uncharacterized protein n=1 Tax=Priceomyces carsonii TaxID=28549 RepID=UPI002ED8B1C9|nr:unnamed protein product [Priceomyces carsonii]